MPYVLQDPNRNALDPHLSALSEQIKNEGDLNYVVTRLSLQLLLRKGLNYANLDAGMGMFLCCLLEMYTRIGRMYEDLKIQQNGDVPEYEEIIKMIREQGLKLPNHRAAISDATGFAE